MINKFISESSGRVNQNLTCWDKLQKYHKELYDFVLVNKRNWCDTIIENLYCIKHMIQSKPICICGLDVKFISFNFGYRNKCTYCLRADSARKYVTGRKQSKENKRIIELV